MKYVVLFLITLFLPFWGKSQQFLAEQTGEIHSVTIYFPEAKNMDIARKYLTTLNGVVETAPCTWHKSIGVRFLSNVTCPETIVQYLVSKKIVAEKTDINLEDLNNLCSTKSLPENTKPVHAIPSIYERNKQIVYNPEAKTNNSKNPNNTIDASNLQPLPTTALNGEPLYQPTGNQAADQERYAAAKLAWKKQQDAQNTPKNEANYSEIINANTTNLTPEEEKKLREAKENYLKQPAE